MIEEIKNDNNCIVKAFENNPISILNEDINNKRVYYFKASDIGVALGLSNIRQSIQNYDDDEQVVRKAYDLRGCLQDTTFLTSQGVYRLLYNSKKEIAKKFRKWAGNILDDIIFNQSQELKKQLEEKENELRKTQKQLEQVSKLKVKKWYDTEPGDILYAVVSNKDEESPLVKLGKSKNGAIRENGYMTHNQNGEMFYIRKCYNCNLAEKVLFHILDKYRVQNNREWFEISRDLAIYTIDAVCNFLDYFINFSEELQHSKLLENLNISLDIVKKLSKDKRRNYNKDEIKQIIPKAPEIKKSEPSKENVYDFVKFFKDRCEIGDDYECSTYDIYGAYRLWSKIVRIEYKNAFTKYLNDNFKKKRKFFNDIKTSMTMFIGFRVKPFVVTQENIHNLPKYEEFILQNCEFGYNYKISVDNLISEMKSWFNKYPDYVYNIGEERRFRAYINRHFIRTNMKIPTETGINECNGIWGLKLKSDKIIRNQHKQHSKKIIKRDINTHEIIEQYDSILMLRDSIKVSYRKINDYITMKIIFDDKYYYEYLK